MAYTTKAELEIAAGGPSSLIELTDLDGDGLANADVIALAQTEADSWIDGYARRLYEVPFLVPIPDAIRMLAASETIYRLKIYKRITGEEDRALHEERDQLLRDLRLGQFNPTTDPYPLQAGGGTPCVVERTYTGDFGRAGTKGFW